MPTKNQATDTYSAKNIKTLTGLAAVRKNLDTYAGSPRSEGDKPSEAMMQTAQEILSNAIDEASGGYGKIITIIIHPDNSMTIKDQGRGIPMGKNFEAVRRQMTTMNTSGKYDSESYKHSIGMHGMGVKITNATSKYIQADVVRQNGTHYLVKYHMEKPLEEKILEKKSKKHSGTSITFLPDDNLYDTIVWNDEMLERKLKQSAYLTPGIKFVFIDERQSNTEQDPKHKYYYQEYFSKNGLTDYVQNIAQDVDLLKGLHKPISFSGNAEVKSHSKQTQGNFNIGVTGGLLYTADSGTTILSFVNNTETNMGGRHVDGAKLGIYQAFRDYAESNKLLKRGQGIDSQDSRDGLILVLSNTIPIELLDWNNQSKTDLRTVEAKKANQNVLYNELTTWLADHPKQAKSLISAMVESKQARVEATKMKQAVRQAKKTKKNDKLYISPNLKTASTKDPKRKELYVVEGLSAASGLTKGRNPKTQAIFPIRGKILNTESVKLSRAIKNNEISTIAAVLKAGIGPVFNQKDLDYDKVIIASDADADGYNIRCLLIVLFANFFKGLIEHGHLYYVNAPLFKISHYVKGKQINDYVYNTSERDQVVKKLGKSAKPTISRFKGLGEMSTDESKKTLMEPKTRHLTRVSISDAEAAKQILKILMGKNAKPRKAWIKENVDFTHTEE